MVNFEEKAKQIDAMKDLFSKLSEVEGAAQNSVDHTNGNLAESFAGKTVTKTIASTGVVADPLIKNILSQFNNLTVDSESQPRALMENATIVRQKAISNELSIEEIKSVYLKFGNGASPEAKEKLKILCQMAMAYITAKRGE